MNDAGYIFAGYFATAGILGAYAAWVVRRKRTLSRHLRSDEVGSAESRQGAGSAESRQGAGSAESRQGAGSAESRQGAR